MHSVSRVALDLLREAATRKWMLAMAVVITLFTLALAVSLHMEVVDGVLAGTRLFGDSISHDLRPTDVALKPVITGASWFVFTVGLIFGTLGCSDFAPELLTPGRIEHLLSLPIRRWELILGTYLGVMALAVMGALYAAGMFTVLLGMKSGIWTMAVLTSGLSACIGFAAVYGSMLACAVFVRSTALSAAVGGMVLVAGSALARPSVAALFEPGLNRTLYLAAVAWLPRFGLLGHVGLGLAGIEIIPADAGRAVAGSLVFGLACLALATWEFERRDF